jgi:hypothetical protein
LDSESKPAIEEAPGDQNMEPYMEETPQTKGFTSLDEGEASTKKKISKLAKIQKMKEKIEEKEVLERVIKARYETLSKNVAKTREAFKRLALIHVKEKKKRKTIMKHNHKLWNISRYLKTKIKMMTTKPSTRSRLQVLATAAENLHQESSK